MYVILEILGKQYKVFEKLKIKISRINVLVNKLIILNKILLFSSNKYFFINNFFLNKIFILARVISHKKLKKIKIFKKKRRKGYLKNIGYRDSYTEIFIEKIDLSFLNYFLKNGSEKIWRFF